MKNIGIVTITDMNNYGNRLQNYAINNELLRIGMNPKNYVHCKSDTKLKMFVYTAMHKGVNAAKRYIIFNHFDKNVKNNYVYKQEMKKESKYNYFICGSDQIWNPEYAGKPFYFAVFAPPEKRIAYAASFGVSEIPEHKKEIYTKYLNEMKAISVREEDGAKIVKELTGRDATVLVDPTLMLDKEEWLKIAKKPKFDVSKKYVLTYFLGEVSGRRKEYIDYVCKQNNLELINLDAKNPNTFWYKTGPAEFLWLIDNASVMLTDSFHGSVFSVLMDTPFLVFDREDNIGEMSSRIDTLLNTLKLQDRRFNNQSGEEIFKKEYAHIPDILKTEREKAIHFLKNAMELK